MNVSLGQQLEKLVENQVKSGLYQNQSEVVRDALRHLFLQDDSDDTDRLAEKLREAKNSPRSPYLRGEFRKMAAEAIAEKRRQKKAA
jgi:putative addiction module CopG family antidote